MVLEFLREMQASQRNRRYRSELLMVDSFQLVILFEMGSPAICEHGTLTTNKGDIWHEEMAEQLM
jgi:hypothetical protein